MRHSAYQERPRAGYTHVTYRERLASPWQVSLRGAYIGSFPDQLSVARAAAQHLSVSANDLRGRGVASPPLGRPRMCSKVAAPQRRQHRGLQWHKTIRKWIVKVGPKTCGVFATYDAALRHTIVDIGRSEEGLRLVSGRARARCKGILAH